MSIPKQVTSYLEKKGVRYEIVPHKKVFTAYDLAQTLGQSLETVAKTLLLHVQLPEIRSKGKYYIVAVPASYKVELERIKKTLRATDVTIASEKVMKKLGIEPGALSPFAALHELELLIDKALLKSKDVFVRAGSLTESLRLKSKDLHKMEQAMAGVFGKKSGIKLQAKPKASKKKAAKKKGGKKVAPKKRVVRPVRPKKTAPKKRSR
ncbi:YbaK/EbsC family protein [Patescibacteria group bacterium]|nr:YbaK/EbsC family protein [Patescibacteria group bacterium]